ncbi:radical SAM protein [Lunatibacter salilacus]|uniref:radical SAM protein n=1 Tax=Lunatibacter salilacus TaxID=2483804 RepID=UPI00131B05C1|nr:radical SAM protein [Lunatibacter salilacus]
MADSINRSRPSYFIQIALRMRVRMHIVFLAFKVYRSIKKVKLVFSEIMKIDRKISGGKRKYVLKNGKYWIGLYMPAFPSKNFDRYILSEMNRFVPHTFAVNNFQQVNFAITTKCPMRCEHCFEWDNLNLHETFTKDELKNVISKLQARGLGHISLSGGEPMVRFNDMLELIGDADKSTAFWVLTSGFNLDFSRAQKLKQAGATGVIVSLDDITPEKHNRFRGHNQAYQLATKAAQATNQAGLMLAISVCVLRENANAAFLTSHAEAATAMGADFIQWLEPKAEGNFRGKDVTLSTEQIIEMEKSFLSLNHDAQYLHIAPIMYHGYYQRRLGCLSAGKSSFYVDSRGMVHSCPFCHSSDYQIMDWLNNADPKMNKISACPSY